MKVLTRKTLSLRPKNDSIHVKAFSWFPLDLQNLLIWWLKFSLLSIWTLRSLTDEVDLIFSFPNLTYYVSIIRGTFVKKNYLSGFTIILLLWSQLIAASHSDSKIGSNSLSVLAKLAKILSSAKLWTEALGMKKKKLRKCYIKLSKNGALGYT